MKTLHVKIVFPNLNLFLSEGPARTLGRQDGLHLDSQLEDVVLLDLELLVEAVQLAEQLREDPHVLGVLRRHDAGLSGSRDLEAASSGGLLRVLRRVGLVAAVLLDTR